MGANRSSKQRDEDSVPDNDAEFKNMEQGRRRFNSLPDINVTDSDSDTEEEQQSGTAIHSIYEGNLSVFGSGYSVLYPAVTVDGSSSESSVECPTMTVDESCPGGFVFRSSSEHVVGSAVALEYEEPRPRWNEQLCQVMVSHLIMRTFNKEEIQEQKDAIDSFIKSATKRLWEEVKESYIAISPEAEHMISIAITVFKKLHIRLQEEMKALILQDPAVLELTAQLFRATLIKKERTDYCRKIGAQLVKTFPFCFRSAFHNET